ncbi:MAG TPA: glycoside hydrolase domain-containing protein [Gemmatimonadaceae bacterium]|nr:glycoside hydrolase domain-containing protein [Gemmatimonadaceae bacterium]
MTRRRRTVVGALAAVSAIYAAPRIARLPLREAAAALVGAPQAMAELPAQMATAATAVATGRHLGFDTHSYPGDRAMRAWRTQAGTPYEWVGYYLPAPCHRDESWSGTRERLADMGWGVAVIYVGQQAWSGARGPSRAAVARARRDGTLSCHRSLLGASRGAAEADDAIARTKAEGFAPGTVIFLDIEHMDLTPPRMREYYRAWTERVLADGRYRPGYYVHTRNAQVVYRDVREVFDDAGVLAEPPFWIASERGFTPGKLPRDVGHDFAAVWQGALDVAQTWNGVRLPIDVNVAALPSPSSHEYAPEPLVAYGD